MSKTVRLCGVVCCLAAVTAISASPSASKQPARVLATAAKAQVVEVVHLRRDIAQLRRSTWRWQRVAGTPTTRTSFVERRTAGLGLLEWARRLWYRRQKTARQHALNPPNFSFWLCVHHGEASWTDHASHNPHYGGYQMGWWFMSHYARRLLARHGTADNWSPLQQTWVVENAFKREGYSRRWLLGQWPATSPPCLNKLGSGA